VGNPSFPVPAMEKDRQAPKATEGDGTEEKSQGYEKEKERRRPAQGPGNRKKGSIIGRAKENRRTAVVRRQRGGRFSEGLAGKTSIKGRPHCGRLDAAAVSGGKETKPILGREVVDGIKETVENAGDKKS